MFLAIAHPAHPAKFNFDNASLGYVHSTFSGKGRQHEDSGAEQSG